MLAFEDAAGLGAGYLSFGYAGGLVDAATGLVHFGAREYDPGTGRWTRPDPIGFAGGDANLYGYVLANPVMFVDPEGLWSINVGGSSIGVDFSGTLYDSKKGFFPSPSPDISVSPTLLGGGISVEFEGNRAPYTKPGEDVWQDVGMSKYLGFGTNQDKTRFRVNVGLSIGLPISKSMGIKAFFSNFEIWLKELLCR